MQTAETATSTQTVEIASCACTSQAFINVPDAANVFGRSKEYLYAGLREGRFPGVRFGRSWAIPRAFVQAFVAEVVELGVSISFEDFAAGWLTKSNKAAA